MDWGTLLRQREHYQVSPPHQTLQPTVPQAFVTACVWGNQYADLVLRFCASLKWPPADVPHTDSLVTAGIAWHELAIAFIVNTGVQFPVWIAPDAHQRARPVHWQDPRVLALPVPKRSLREQAEAFRTIVLYLPLVASLLLVVRPGAPDSVLAHIGQEPLIASLLLVRPGAPGSVLAPSSDARSPW